MLSKLLAKGLIKEMDNGRYSATKKGIDILADIESARNILQGQIDILPRISKVVKLATDRLFTRGSVLSLVLDKIRYTIPIRRTVNYSRQMYKG